MTQNTFYVQKLLLGLILLVTCTSIIASSSSRERRHVGVEESSHRPDKIRTPGSRSFKSSTSKNNEITAEPGRKVSHRLIGGHLRADTKQERDEALWDDGILMSSAGNGKERKHGRGDEDDEKKTLSQQVKEGKYGLIQDEIYKNRPKRPGIISYLGNPEVPKDTIDNLGGLDEDEIWLAENHVLVLRGGKFPEHEAGQGSGNGADTWPPIDNYKAPRRQVKIPSRPKVPPPFPVQLAEGGPIQIFLPNGTKEIKNGTLDYEKDPLYRKGLLPGEGPFFAITSNGTILTPDLDNSRNVTEEKPLYVSHGQGKTKSNLLPPSALPPYHAIPPGAVFVPPPSNETDYDDDDQSIYYPPPYSFYYQRDNTTAVPPGPLVPGIILPPPPDFFSVLDDKKSTTKKYTKRPGTTPLPRLRPTYLPPRKLTTKHYKSSTTVPTTETRKSVFVPVTRVYNRATHKNANTTSTTTTIQTTPYIEVTTPSTDKSTTLDNAKLYSAKPIVRNRASETIMPEKGQTWSGTVTSKTAPILTYYATTTQTSLEKPVEVTPASIKNIITTSSPGRTPNQASYYFYEESSDGTTSTTVNPSTLYYRTTTESPYVRMETQPRVEERKKQYYSVETVPSQETSKDYSIKFVDSVVKNAHVFEYSDSGVPRTSTKYENNSGRTQGQRMIADHTPVYYQTITPRPSVAIQSYYTTPKPDTYYRQDAKPKPIYQYSFEAADYTKHQKQLNQFQQAKQSIPYNDYQDTKPDRHQYEYEDIASISEQGLRGGNIPYKSQPSVYSSTTTHSILSTTQNPQHAYFTRQDERLLDDVTKEYFTIFGKKLPDKGIPNTTPIYGKTSVTERPNYNVNSYVQNTYKTGVSEPPVYRTPNVKVYYGDQHQPPYSLKDDILVNYRKPLPPINPDSEYITVPNPKQQLPLQTFTVQPENYRLQDRGGNHERVTPNRGYTPQQILNQRNGPSTDYVPIAESPEELDEEYPHLPLSLADDIEVNYRDPRPTINPDAEFIDPIPVQENHSENPKAYFAYRLPGDGGHFYFLTPQAITHRPEQSGGYIYPKSRGTRLLRRRRRPSSI